MARSCSGSRSGSSVETPRIFCTSRSFSTGMVAGIATGRPTLSTTRRQVGLFVVVVVALKRRRSPLGIAAPQRRRLKLGKVLRLHAVTEALYDRLLHFKYLFRLFGAQGKRQVVEVDVEVDLAPQLKRDFGDGQYFHLLDLQLDVAVLHSSIHILFRPGVDLALYRHHVLGAHVFGRLERLRLG